MSTLESDSPQSTLWLIDDDPALRLILADTFSDADMDVVSFTQAKAAWTRLNDMLSTGDYSQLPDVILTDIRMPLMDGLSFSDWVHKKFPELPIIIMTAHSDLQSAVDSYQTGAFDYLPKPFDLDDAVATIKKAIKPRHQASVITAAEKDDSDSISLNQDSGDLKNNDMAALTQAEARQHKVLSNSPANVKPKPTSKTVAQSNVSIDSMATKHEAKVKPNNAKSAQPTKKGNTNPNGIIGQSPAMQTVFRAIGRLSHSPITVLITGESGTGKELVANALHQHSPRHNKPFIALNMAAIPHDLIESELFGHEKGAFTGAATLRQGRFEQANGGTLFLDEIGDMPFSTQTRLLRVLANGEFYRVGGQKPIKVDVRIIAATHQNLEHLVKLGKFREDLFYRLNVIRLPLPPLRERREDIPALVEHFMQRAAKEMDTAQKYIAPDALFIMQAFDWSGNVRQIENACRWLTVMATGDTVLAEDLPPELTDFINQYPASIPAQSPISAPLSSPASLTSEDSSTYPDASSQNTSTVQPNRPSSHADYNTGSSTANGRDIEVAHHHATVANPANTINTASLSHFTASAPPSTSETPSTAPYLEPWQLALANWANAALARGETDILQEATPEFERILLTVALAHSKGRKGDAAALLGWGRNTLTRKLKLLDIE
ncbi:MAG: sigma 54-interacting transcriptional regulator [Psychrobacter sp.]|nr:sigma 54-interacting transcriptional regulator [Psychrobacter sp.]